MASLSEVAVAGATEPRAFGTAWSPIRMGIIMMFIFWEWIWDIYMIYDIYIYALCIYIYGYNVFYRPHLVFSSIVYVQVSEMLCPFQRCCARVTKVVHVSQAP